MKKMKKALTVLAYLLFPILATSIAAGFGNIFITIGVFVVSIAVLAVILRADLFMLIGTFTYQKNREKGLKWMQSAMKTDKMRPRSQLLYAYLLVRNGYLDEAEAIINKTTYLGKNILKENDLKLPTSTLRLSPGSEAISTMP